MSSIELVDNCGGWICTHHNDEKETVTITVGNDDSVFDDVQFMEITLDAWQIEALIKSLKGEEV